jgi:hypothetical protein
VINTHVFMSDYIRVESPTPDPTSTPTPIPAPHHKPQHNQHHDNKAGLRTWGQGQQQQQQQQQQEQQQQQQGQGLHVFEQGTVAFEPYVREPQRRQSEPLYPQQTGFRPPTTTGYFNFHF